VLELVSGAVDFADAGKEGEDISGGVGKCGVNSVCGGVGDGEAFGVGYVFEVDGELAAFAAEDGTVIEEFGDGFGFHGGRHDDDFEVRPDGMSDAAGHGECEVGVESSFVEFVEYDGADIFEEGIILEFAEEDTFGDDEDFGVS
jgi:hypothetical protein